MKIFTTFVWVLRFTSGQDFSVENSLSIIRTKVVSLITEHLSSSNLDSWQIKVRATSEGPAEHAEHWTHYMYI